MLGCRVLPWLGVVTIGVLLHPGPAARAQSEHPGVGPLPAGKDGGSRSPPGAVICWLQSQLFFYWGWEQPRAPKSTIPAPLGQLDCRVEAVPVLS